jgi:hypothetical protein
MSEKKFVYKHYIRQPLMHNNLESSEQFGKPEGAIVFCQICNQKWHHKVDDNSFEYNSVVCPTCKHEEPFILPG